MGVMSAVAVDMCVKHRGGSAFDLTKPLMCVVHRPPS
jgi:hypothetical protein